MTTKKVLKKQPSNISLKQKELSKFSKENKKIQDEEPSWYHYAIILGGLILLIIGAYILFEIFSPNQDQDFYENLEDKPTFMYEHKIGDISYNIEFSTSFDKIKELDYQVPITEFDLFNTQRFYFSFMLYNGTDNGQVTYSAIKLRRFLSSVYFFNFQPDQFVSYDNITCANSTKTSRVVVFDIYSNQTGIRTDDNGCLYFESESPYELLELVDTFMYHMIVKE